MFDKMAFADLQSTVHKRANAFVSEHNSCQGQDNLPFQVREVAARTLEKIIAKYNREFWKTIKNPLFADDDRMPTILITRAEITNLVGGGIRSVGKRIGKLCHLDIIRVHASCDYGYKISLNPYFMFGSDFADMPKIEKLKIQKDYQFKVFFTPEVQSLHTLYGFKVEEINNKYKAEKFQFSKKNEERDNQADVERKLIPLKKEASWGQKSTKGDSNPQESKNVKLGGCEVAVEPGNGILTPDVLQKTENEQVNETAGGDRAAKMREKAFQKNKNFLYQPNIRRITESEKKKFVDNFYEHMVKTVYPTWTLNKTVEMESKHLIRTEVFGSFGADFNYTEWYCQYQMLRGMLDQHAQYHQTTGFVPYFPTKWLKRKDENGHNRKANFFCTLKFIGKSKSMLVDEQKEYKLQTAIDHLINERYPKKMAEKSMRNLYTHWFNRLSRSTDTRFTARFYDFAVQYNSFINQPK